MYALVFVVPFVALWVALRRTPLLALLAVYLPLLLLVPESFRATLQGIPKMNFNQAAIVPIALLAFARYGRDWRPSVTDVAVLLLALIVAVSEFLAAGYKEAQNLMCHAGIDGRAVHGGAAAARRPRQGRRRGSRFAILVFAAVFVGVYEFRFGVNPFLNTLGMLFPGQGLGWVTTFRHGFARVAGPYSHAILAGIMVVIAYRLARWVQRGDHWEPRFAGLPGLALSALTVWGVRVTVGHALLPSVDVSADGTSSIMGKKMQASGERRCFTVIRLCTCARATFDGKQGSMAPRLAPLRYISVVVVSEYTR